MQAQQERWVANPSIRLSVKLTHRIHEYKLSCCRFSFLFRWVKKLYPAYRAYQNGKETTLNKDRIKKLLDLGFEFDVVSNAKANTNLHALFEVPFERRLDQLKKCKEELGHLQIDYRYNKM
mmetsp:Transcript_28050/g.45557  ORF Transcript_28050/g.45557 Transcript_28050/m.45557 type:complete len:121 (-) Transcript_28050:802-1164(-)